MRLDDLEARFAARRAQGLRRNLEITDEGVLLGAGTLLAGLALDGEEARILAVLSAAFACAVSPQILDILGKAIALWKGGEKFRAQLHLTYARLPPLTEEQAFALCAADELLKEGMTPRALTKGLGLDPAALDALEKYNPDQPRVPAGSGRASGRWGSGRRGSNADRPRAGFIRYFCRAGRADRAGSAGDEMLRVYYRQLQRKHFARVSE